MINKSLLTLGKVIMALVDGGKAHIPYRESALTWLLKVRADGAGRSGWLARLHMNPGSCDVVTATPRCQLSPR